MPAAGIRVALYGALRPPPAGRLSRNGMEKFHTLYAIVLAAFAFFEPALAEASAGSYWRREHSLLKPYASTTWDFAGSTVTTPNYCRITGEVQSQRGSLWNNVPVMAHNWELHVHFKVHGKGSGNMQGDGMAIWYARDRMKPGPVFGNEDHFSGLAVMLDTYSNQETPHRYAHPFVSAMINNGSLRYDHEHDGDGTRLAGCHSNFRNRKYDTLIAIRYKDNLVKVSMDLDGKDVWQECFTASDIRLPTGYYLGITAATGELTDNHDIISMKFFELQPSEGAASVNYEGIVPGVDPSSTGNNKEDKSEQTGSAASTILYALLFVGIAGAMGYVLYHHRQNTGSKKRFY